MTNRPPLSPDEAHTVPRTGDDPRLSNTEQAYRELKRQILANELPAGSQLLELQGAARLGMSRTPVREAMVRLAQEGMVEIRPRHGMRVLPVSPDDMREIYEVLTALESQAAELVARRGLEEAELAKLRGAVEAMETALAGNDLEGWSEADRRFHALLVEFARNRRLAALVEQISDQAHRARTLTLRLRPKPEQSNREHRALLDAIERRDPATARQVHESHRRHAGEMLVQLIESLGFRQL